MKKSLRVLALILALLLFGLFALGSGSKKASENKGDDGNNAVEAADADGNGEPAASSEKKAEYKSGEVFVNVAKNSIGTNYITVSWPVTNTGTVNLYLKSGSAEVENGNGELQDTLSSIDGYPEVLKPGETGYYFERTQYDGTATSGLKVVPHANIEEASVDCIRYTISDLTIKDETYGGVKVLGRAENTTDKDQSSVTVAALLFDSEGRLIGVDIDYIDGGLAAGEKKAFECTGLRTDLKSSAVAKYEVYAYPALQINW